jgi:hypothetical protein
MRAAFVSKVEGVRCASGSLARGDGGGYGGPGRTDPRCRAHVCEGRQRRHLLWSRRHGA